MFEISDSLPSSCSPSMLCIYLLNLLCIWLSLRSNSTCFCCSASSNSCCFCFMSFLMLYLSSRSSSCSRSSCSIFLFNSLLTVSCNSCASWRSFYSFWVKLETDARSSLTSYSRVSISDYLLFNSKFYFWSAEVRSVTWPCRSIVYIALKSSCLSSSVGWTVCSASTCRCSLRPESSD